MSNIIEYANITLRRSDLTVLSDITLKIGQGEYVYITGSVGSGKSTFLKSIYADIKIEGDEARVFDYDLKRIRKSEIPLLRRNIGFIFQDFMLLNDRDIFSNLDFVLQSIGIKEAATRIDRVHAALQTVGLKEKSYKLPFELSEGERQLVAVARSFINTPQLILADEPTANLDKENGKHIVSLLQAYARKGATVIIATHNHALMETFPGRQLYCHDHKIYEI